MARIIYSPVVTEIKGSIGGMTFQKNASGAIARLKPKKAKTNTQKQKDQQPRTKLLQQYWQNLTLAQKIEWNTFAGNHNKIGLNGQEKKLTGYQWFLTINQNRLLFDNAMLSVPPVYEIVNPIDSVSLNFDESGLRFDIYRNDFTTPYNEVAYCSFIINSVSKFDFNKTRLMRKLTATSRQIITINNAGSRLEWDNYFKTPFPPNLENKPFYLVGYIRDIGVDSGISSLAYTAIAHFVWDGTKYVIEEF